MDVAVTARTREQVEEVAREIGGLPLVGDVARPEDVERWVDEIGVVDLLVANAGRNVREQHAWEVDADEWWNVFEVNVRGVYSCCRAVIPRMVERGRGRIVIVGSGSAYLPQSGGTAYSASKAAVCRFGEVLAEQLAGRIPVFVISPGLVRTEMSKAAPDDAPWTPPELAPRLVRSLASGQYDALAGRYLHAEHDDVDDLLTRIDEIRERDLNAIRLRR
jgi:3-oxoacyl-[acyl-carrier protein] reductase